VVFLAQMAPLDSRYRLYSWHDEQSPLNSGLNGWSIALAKHHIWQGRLNPSRGTGVIKVNKVDVTADRGA
jgi:hypothetical protein